MSRRQRFGNLLAGLNYLRPITGGSVSGEAPVGTPLRNFQEYRAGRVRRTVTRAENSYPGRRSNYKINLFSEPNTSNLAITTLGSRARGNLTGLSLDLDVLGLEAIATGQTVTPQFTGRFTPAKVTCFRSTATGRGTPTNSRITGLSYRQKEGSSNTFPFGRASSGATQGYRERAIAIDSATGPTVTCSFTPEDIAIII